MQTYLIAATAVLLLARAALADHLPPVDPILVGTDHSHENHDGHDHHGETWEVLLVGASFRNSDLNDTRIFGGLSGADFSGASMRNGQLGSASGDHVNFSNVDFRGRYFNDANLLQSNFQGAQFGGAILDELTANGSDFRGASFHDPVFGNVIISETFFFGADLRGVDFSGLYIFKGFFDGADMRGINLRGTIFDDFLLRESLDTAIFDASSIYDAQTVFPAGFDPVAAGLTFVPEPCSLLLAAVGAPFLFKPLRRR